MCLGSEIRRFVCVTAALGRCALVSHIRSVLSRGTPSQQPHLLLNASSPRPLKTFTTFTTFTGLVVLCAGRPHGADAPDGLLKSPVAAGSLSLPMVNSCLSEAI